MIDCVDDADHPDNSNEPSNGFINGVHAHEGKMDHIQVTVEYYGQYRYKLPDELDVMPQLLDIVPDTEYQENNRSRPKETTNKLNLVWHKGL